MAGALASPPWQSDAMPGTPLYGQPSRLDWNRIDAWSQQLARGDLSQIKLVFAAAGALEPRVQWRPQRWQIVTSQLHFLLDYWSDLRGAADLPRAEAVDLRQLSPILGYETLVDVVDGGRDFRYRWCGNMFIGVTGNDMTGRLLSEYPARPYVVESSVALYRAAWRRCEPVYTERAPAGATVTRLWQRLLLPLADAEGRVESFLVGIIPIGADGLVAQMQG